MSQLTAFDKFMQQALKYGFTFIGVPKTGQTTSYRTGDDGAYQKGAPATGARFIDNADGTITDRVTGLMWVKQPENIGGIWESAGQPVKMTWNDGIDNCNALNYAGYADWRLPNAAELATLFDYAKYNPAIDTAFFPNTKSANYLTSTTYKNNTANCEILNFTAPSIYPNAKTTAEYLRPVRGG